MAGVENQVLNGIPRAAIPQWVIDVWAEDGIDVDHPPSPDEFVVFEAGDSRRKPEPEYNPEWEEENFGFRGQVAKLLFERGLKKKAHRFANCFRMGRPGVCSRYPFEHKFFKRHGCGVIFCKECGDLERWRLMVEYFPVVLAVVSERSPCGCLPLGWVLARLTFTLRSDGGEITSDQVKGMNEAAKRTVRKSVGSRSGYGLLYCDEVGFETRGHILERKTGGLNLHLHGLYFGPYLDWEKTRDLWKAETRKQFGVESSGCWVGEVRVRGGDLQGAVRHALNHLLKYVSKPPAVSSERLASLIAAFDKARRVHGLGLFHGKKPKREKQDCQCPKCKAVGVFSIISFEGQSLPGGGCIPRFAPVEDLIPEGYEELVAAGRSAVLSMGVAREDSWGESP